MGTTAFPAKIRGFPQVSCNFLQISAAPNPSISRASRESARICKMLRKHANMIGYLPLSFFHVASPDIRLIVEILKSGREEGQRWLIDAPTKLEVLVCLLTPQTTLVN